MRKYGVEYAIASTRLRPSCIDLRESVSKPVFVPWSAGAVVSSRGGGGGAGVRLRSQCRESLSAAGYLW